MKTSRTALFGIATAALLLPALVVPGAASAVPKIMPPAVSVLTDGLEGASGSTIGPDKALYVTEGSTGEITRIDTKTGATSTFARGLPPAVIGLGGVIDVAFIGQTAYALVTLVGEDVGGTEVNGIYRIDDTDSFTVVADIGAWAIDNPPDTSFDVPSGLQFAFQRARGGFLVTDGHHNRVLFVTKAGDVSEVIQLGNTVPTGLDVSGKTVYLAEAGPVPHLPEDGRVVSFSLKNTDAQEAHAVASGHSLLVDVESGRCGALFALSQGDSPGDVPPASPALPDSGELLSLDPTGALRVVVGGLDLPTSLEIVRRTAYVVTMSGEVLKITNVALPGGGKHGKMTCRSAAKGAVNGPQADRQGKGPGDRPGKGPGDKVK